MIISALKQPVLDAQKADETALGYPKLEGHWAGGGIHVIGPDPHNPEALITEHLSDVLQATTGEYGYEPAVEPKIAPTGCTLATWDEKKRREATPVSAAVAAPKEEEIAP